VPSMTSAQPASLLNLAVPSGGAGLPLQIRPPSLMAQPLMQQRPPVNLTGPPPNMQNALMRPPPGFPSGQLSLQSLVGRPPPSATSMAQTMPPGIPPGAHINPQVYPNFGKNVFRCLNVFRFQLRTLRQLKAEAWTMGLSPISNSKKL
jgi:hypothetical protein